MVVALMTLGGLVSAAEDGPRPMPLTSMVGFNDFKGKPLPSTDNTVRFTNEQTRTYSGWVKVVTWPVRKSSRVVVEIKGTAGIHSGKFLKLYTRFKGRDMALKCTDSLQLSDDPEYIIAGDGRREFAFPEEQQGGEAECFGLVFPSDLTLKGVELTFSITP
jgi:hypothetical protein